MDAPTIRFEFNKQTKEAYASSIVDHRPESKCDLHRTIENPPMAARDVSDVQTLNEKFNAYLDEFINAGYKQGEFQQNPDDDQWVVLIKNVIAP